MTDVYDVIEVLGQGHMGEVFTVRRKTTGMHNKLSKDRARESAGDLKGLLEKAEGGNKGEGKKAEPEKKRHTIKGALHKGKKVGQRVIRKSLGTVDGSAMSQEAASSLEQYIRLDGANESHEPPKKLTSPLRSIMRAESESNYSARSAASAGLDLKGLSEDGSEERPSSPCPPSPCPPSPCPPSPALSNYSERSHRRFASTVDTAKKGVTVHFQRTFAVKTILTTRINKEQVQELVNEILIMRKLVS